MAKLQLVLIFGAIAALLGLFVWTRYRDRIPRKLPERLKLQVRTEPALADESVRTAPAQAEPVASPLRMPGKIITLRLMCRDKQGFPGEQLILSLREEGLRHGRFGIFHRLSDDATEDAVFSVANLVEPGSFDLTRVKTDHYPGVSLFMMLPGPVEGVAAFDDLVGSARKLATALGGDLLDEQGSTLSIQRQRYLREEIIQFQLKHPS